MYQLGEVYQLETADGKSLFIPSSGVRLVAYGSYGAPPITFTTRKLHLQDGVTELSYSVEPRSIPVRIFKAAATSRMEYWNNRLKLHEFFRPNRNGDLILTLRLSSGDLRALHVRTDPGMQFQSQADDNSWNIDDTLTFVAFNPIWYNPVATQVRFNQYTGASLVFPITFPITFGPNGMQFAAVVNYLGSWRAYPKITLTGPYLSAVIDNETTGKRITLDAPLVAGETRIIDLTPGRTSILDSTGDSHFGEFGPDSDLTDFTIRPAPEVPEGSNEGPYFQATQYLQADRYHRLNEPTNSDTAFDEGTDRAIGRYVGVPTLDSAGVLGEDIDTGSYFSGSGNSVELTPMNFTGQSYAFEFFIQPGVQTGTGLIFTADDGVNRLEISLTTTGRLRVQYGLNIIETAASSVITNLITHVVVSFSNASGQTVIYLNGVQAANGLIGRLNGPAQPIASPFYSTYVGLIDEFAIYLNNLTPKQVQDKYSRLIQSRPLYAVGGRQVIRITLFRADGNSDAAMEYNERFYGL